MANLDKDKIRAALDPADMHRALALLTRLPLPPASFDNGRPAAKAAWAYPLVGIVTGLMALAIGGLFHCMGTPAGVTAGIILIISMIITGAMHEDGLADCADGFWGGWDRARRLEIMKDSNIGTYGVLALVMLVVLRWYLLSLLIVAGPMIWPVLVAALMSRSAMVAVMHLLPNARDNGLSANTGRPGETATGIAIILAIIAAFAAPGVSGFALIMTALLCIGTITAIARAKIGGQTGDVLGATQQITEIAVLTCWSMAV